MKTHALPAGFRPARRDELYQEQVHDPYQLRGKLAEPSACGLCGAIYVAGRWRWAPRPVNAHEVVCPACARIRDHLPAGFVYLSGPFFTEHRDELLRLVRHHLEKQKAEHPLQRIIDIDDAGEETVITTTDIHLARDIGAALHDAYQGELEYHYNPGEWLLRVHWQR